MPSSVSEVMRWLSEDPARCEELFARFEDGMRDEWDCGIREGIFLFGGRELALAARSGSYGTYE